MKSMKKLLAITLVLVMLSGLAITASAAVTADSGKGGDASITITLPDNPNTDEDPEITYTLYKVFNGTSDGTSTAIAYTIDPTNGDLTEAMIAAGFSADAAGNISFDEDKSMATDGNPADAAIAAVAAYAKDKIGEFKAKASDKTLTITGLEYGYYYIDTTVGSLVTIDSTTPNAAVIDKNEITKPPVKTIGEDFEGSVDEAGKNAIEQVGTTVPFSVEILVAKGAANYVFHDVMSTGLTYNNDVAVDPSASVDNTDTATGDTLTVTFDNAWLAANAGKTITITYSATVNSDALTIDYANNTASLDYGDGNTTDTDEVRVYTAKLTVSKEDGSGKPLEGAGFIIKNSENKYYKLDNGVVTWVDEAQAEEHTSDDTGAVAPFEGLADGTYTLIEKTVPAGYKKAADQTFTIAESDYTAENLEQEATVVNEEGSELPSTGGIGTTLFYVIGSILFLGAAVVLVTKRRVHE